MKSAAEVSKQDSNATQSTPLVSTLPRRGRSRGEGRESFLFSGILFRLYGVLKHVAVRHFIIKTLKYLEGNELHSLTIRRIFSHYHKVDIGLNTGAGCFEPGNMAPGSRFGRYCSIAYTSCTFTRPVTEKLKSIHPIFTDPQLGFTDKDMRTNTDLSIGNDVWLGHNSIILPSVSSIGSGAVIGAGAVVRKDVPAYSIVVGNPARIVKRRFSMEVIETLLQSKWWESPLEELLENLEDFQCPIEGKRIR